MLGHHRVGSVALAIPRVRDGSHIPSLLQPQRRTKWYYAVGEKYGIEISTSGLTS